MEAILKAVKKRRIRANPAIVISNRADAEGLKIAKKLGVATEIVPSVGFSGTRRDYDGELIRILRKYNVRPTNGLVCLAGFMRILSPEFVKKYKNRILNIHPSLLPSFPGLGAQKQAIKYGAKFSGCTVHFVDAQIDGGPVVIQSVVKVMDDDTEDTLAKRILTEEHKIYPEAISLFAKNRIKVIGRRAVIG